MCRSRGRKRRTEHACSSWLPVVQFMGAQVSLLEKLANTKRIQWYFRGLLFGIFFVLYVIWLLVLFIFMDFF